VIAAELAELLAFVVDVAAGVRIDGDCPENNEPT